MTRKNVAKRTQQALEQYNKVTDMPLKYSSEFISNFSLLAWESKDWLKTILRRHPDYDEKLNAIPISYARSQQNNCFKQFNEFIEAAISPEYANIIICALELQKVTPELYEIISPKKPDSLKRAIALAIYKDLTRIYNDTKVADKRASALMKQYPEINPQFYLSAEPADILTSSNPKHTINGKDSLVSCHSLNNQHCTDYRTGAQSLAMDKVTLILFQVNDIDSEQRYTRKTFRQLYFYNRAILLQSRQYNADSYFENDELFQLVRQALIDCDEFLLKDEESTQLHCPDLNKEDEEQFYYSLVHTHPAYLGYCDWNSPATHKLYCLTITPDIVPLSQQKITIGCAPLCYSCGDRFYNESQDTFTGYHGFCKPDDEEE